MSRDYKSIKYFTSNSRIQHPPVLSDSPEDIPKPSSRLNSPTPKSTLPTQWPPVSHKPSTPSCRSPSQFLKDRLTPTSSSDHHPIPYTFTSKPNTLSSKGLSKSVKVLPKKLEEKKSELSDLLTQVKQTVSGKKSQLSQEEIKSRSENYYREHLFQTFQALKFVRNLPSLDTAQLRQKRINLPKRPGYENKKTIVFDLDETLVHCVDNLAAEPQAKLKIRFPTGEYVDAGINVRPYARECLSEANKNFEVIVFTASHKCYADVVLNYLDPNGELIHHRLYRENCMVVEGVFIKDLRILNNRRIQDIVIVDNAAYSFGYQLDNGIPIISWHDDEYDKELLNLIDYLKYLANAEDVREINRQIFHLRTFYEDYIQEFLNGDRSKVNSLGGSKASKS